MVNAFACANKVSDQFRPSSPDRTTP
jgi:hypothetical protein